MYCTIKFKVYPNVILDDPLLSSQQIALESQKLQPLREEIYTNDPKLLASDTKVKEINEYIGDSDSCLKWVVKNHPAYFLGMSAKVYDNDYQVFSMEVPFGVTKPSSIAYYRNDKTKTVVKAVKPSIPYWCSEQDRYEWTRDVVVKNFGYENVLGKFQPTPDITLQRVMTTADREDNDMMKAVEQDEFLTNHGYYYCEHDEAVELKNHSGYKERTFDEVCEEVKQNEIPEPVIDDNSYKSSSSYEKDLFGESEDDDILGFD